MHPFQNPQEAFWFAVTIYNGLNKELLGFVVSSSMLIAIVN